MLQTLNNSLVEAVMHKYKLAAVKEELVFDIEVKIRTMPHHMRVFVRLFSFIFEYSFVFIYMAKFSKLSINKRIKILSFIKKNKVPFYAIYIKLFETITIINGLEVSSEKKI